MQTKTWVSYSDILTAALVFMEGGEEAVWKNDFVSWCAAVKEICEKFQEQFPELQRISFDRWGGSGEVEQWRHVLAQARFYEWFISEDTARILTESNGIKRILNHILAVHPGCDPALKEMAKILERHLALSASS